jgi:hypothetical protein
MFSPFRPVCSSPAVIAQVFRTFLRAPPSFGSGWTGRICVRRLSIASVAKARARVVTPRARRFFFFLCSSIPVQFYGGNEMSDIFKWNSTEILPNTGQGVLLAFSDHITIGHADEWDGKPCFVNEAGLVVHGVVAWADLPQIPPASFQRASGSSEVNFTRELTNS